MISFFAVVLIVNLINDKKEDSKIRELRNGCANNDAQACYELGISNYYATGLFNSEKIVDTDEKNEALAKGCQLGNKDACRAAGYYKEGCELRDGESCFKLFEQIIEMQGVMGIAACNINKESKDCKIYMQYDANDAKEYQKLACEYGYSQGCMKE